MKKVFISACAVVAILAMAAPAFALDFGSITLGGYYRTRAWWWSEPDLNDKKDPNNRSYIDGRLRIEPTWKINDNVTLKQRWEMDLGSFEGPQVDAKTGSGDFDPQELDIVRAWAEIKLPLGKFSFGRMPISWGQLISDNGSELEGFRLDMKFGPVSVFPFYFKNYEGDQKVLDDQENYGVGFLYKQEWLEAGSVFKYNVGYSSTPETRYHGSQDVGRPAASQQEFQVLPYMKAVFGPLVASTEWMLRFGTAWEDDVEVKNKAFRNAKGVANLRYNCKPFVVIAEGGWAKGERDPIEDKAYGNPWHSDRDVDVILWERIEGTVNNAGFLRLEGTWQATKKLKIVAQVMHSWRDQKPEDVAAAMGIELDTWINYKIVDNFEFNLTGGVLFPGSYYSDLKDLGESAPGGVSGDDASYLLKGEFRVFF